MSGIITIVKVVKELRPIIDTRIRINTTSGANKSNKAGKCVSILVSH